MPLHPEQIRAYLSKLNPNDDDHWTEDGAPSLAGLPKGTARADVTKAAPKFSRKSIDLSAVDPEPPPPAAAEPEAAKPLEGYSTGEEYRAWCREQGCAPNKDRLDQLQRMDAINAQRKNTAARVHTERELRQQASGLLPKVSPLDAAMRQRRPGDRPGNAAPRK